MKLIAVLLVLSLLSCSTHKAHKDHYLLKKVVKGKYRSLKNKTRDVYRHPIETLEFFGVRPHMKVAEISPRSGWYSEILGPYLKKSGKLYLSIFSDNSPRKFRVRLNKRIRELTSNKKLFGKLAFSTLESSVEIQPIAPDNSLDRVLTFRNIHNWMKDSKAREVFKIFYMALKPGGVLGVVEHRAKMNKKQDPRALSGYVREDYVIELAESLGFKFVAKSEVNANYNDSTAHPRGVWTLPPRLRLKKRDRAKYLAIGESDRMTIKFVKPSP